MTFDLRREAWLPFRCRNGDVIWAGPTALTDGIGTDREIVALAAPRADFNGALTEFLVGLMTAALVPADEDAWFEHWNAPPSPEKLQLKLASLPDAFQLLGDGPRFLQDYSPQDLEGDARPIEALLMDSPGEKGKSENTDLFVKRDRARVLGLSAAAMALITMQTYAPAGGQGNRVSVRGGGPLTTLVEPRPFSGGGKAHALWFKIWANVPVVDQFENFERSRKYSDAEVFPWLACTRTSNEKAGGGKTLPQDGHPLQAMFGIPRRIRLIEDVNGGHCDLTGRSEAVVVTGFQSVNYGVNYTGWRHPLSPYYKKDAKGEFLPLHPQSGGLSWKDWTGLMLRDPGGDASRIPASCVSRFAQRRAELVGLRRFRLDAWGYEMDKMKASSWLQHEMPGFVVNGQQAGLIWRLGENLTKAADTVARATEWAVKNALFDNAKDARGDFTAIRRSVWNDTQGDFLRSIEQAIADGTPIDIVTVLSQNFLAPLRRVALAAFDQNCSSSGIEHQAMRRLIAARYRLTNVLRGYGKEGGALFEALMLPKPEGAAKAKAQKTPRKNA